MLIQVKNSVGLQQKDRSSIFWTVIGWGLARRLISWNFAPDQNALGERDHPVDKTETCEVCHGLELGSIAMVDAANYSAVETLRDGRRLEICAFRPSDQAELQSAVGRTSARSLYRRFFTVKRSFSEKERGFFLNVDFVGHVALMAWTEESGQEVIVGGGRYVVVEPGKAEVAFVVIDQYQGQGVGAALMRHLASIARAAGLKELVAEVLAENAPMLKVFEKSGLPTTTTREADVVQVSLRLN
jgi:GNAT superfamily N-acetyltransferase